MRRWWCILWGTHMPVLKHEGNRLYLRCENCKTETPGWMTGKVGSKR